MRSVSRYPASRQSGLLSLTQSARFNNATVTVVTAREALKDLLAVLNRQVSIENIQKIVADYFKIKVSEMY